MIVPRPAVESPRVYLAGPEVFLSDAETVLARKKAICARLGLIGVCPLLDAPGPAAQERSQRAFAIAATNEALIRSCVAIIANLTPFRGASADAGTVYELGFARGLGLGLYAYTNDPRDYAARVLDDPDQMDIEDFGLSDNLMLEGGIAAAGGVFVRATAAAEDPFRDLGVFETCARAASRRLVPAILAPR